MTLQNSLLHLLRAVRRKESILEDRLKAKLTQTPFTPLCLGRLKKSHFCNTFHSRTKMLFNCLNVKIQNISVGEVFIIDLEMDQKHHKTFTVTKIRYLTVSQIYSLWNMLTVTWPGALNMSWTFICCIFITSILMRGLRCAHPSMIYSGFLSMVSWYVI